MIRKRFAALGALLVMVLGIFGYSYAQARQERLSVELTQALEREDAPATRALLKQGAGIADRDWTPGLRWAVRANHTDIARHLLQRGADARAIDRRRGTTLLMEAALNDNGELVRALLSRGADPAALTHAAETSSDPDLPAGQTALMLAITQVPKRADAIASLARARAGLNVRDAEGRTPLLAAAVRADVDTTRLLLEAGADVNARSTDGLTALLMAPLGKPEGLDLGDLMFLAQSGNKANPELIRLLLSHGADVNAMNDAGATPLIGACMCGDTPTVRGLLAAGADVNRHRKGSGTALVMAAITGHTNVVRVLLDAGAEINARGENGQTPLMAAAYRHHSHIIQLLLQRGANPALRDNHGRTALALATDGDGNPFAGFLPGGNRREAIRVLREARSAPMAMQPNRR